MIALYASTAGLNPYLYAASKTVCAYSTGVCPDSGTFTLTPPTKVDKYSIYYVAWVNATNGNVAGMYNLDTGYNAFLVYYYVLDATSNASVVNATKQLSGPMGLFASRNAAAAAAAAARALAMQARLSLAQTAINQIRAMPPNSMTIQYLQPDNTVFLGSPTPVCFFILDYLAPSTWAFSLELAADLLTYYNVKVSFINASCATVTLPQLIPLTIQYRLSLNDIIRSPPLAYFGRDPAGRASNVTAAILGGRCSRGALSLGGFF